MISHAVLTLPSFRLGFAEKLLIWLIILSLLLQPALAAIPRAREIIFDPSSESAIKIEDAPPIQVPYDLPDELVGKREIATLRTANSTAFDMGNGQLALLQESTPLHFQDGDGNWQPIDPLFQIRGATQIAEAYYDPATIAYKQTIVGKDGAWAGPVDHRTVRALLRFEMPKMPENTTISKAYLMVAPDHAVLTVGNVIHESALVGHMTLHSIQPRLSLDNDVLSFLAKKQTGGEAATQSVQWANIGGGQLTPQVTSDASWIKASLVSNMVQVGVDHDSLTPGYYSGIVKLGAAAGSDPLMGGAQCIRVNTWVLPADNDTTPTTLKVVYLPIVSR